jgi:putative chitinase
MPHLLPQRAASLLPFLDAACTEAEIVTPLRLAAFLAQLAHESAELRYFEEIASGAEYEGRLDLGNLMPGDGSRYKGRGPIQLTGRTNYRAAGVALGLDLEAHPEQVATPAVGFRVAGWFWTSHRLNVLADVGHFRSITRVINGGLNGELSREAYYTAALRALGVQRPSPAA